MLSPTKKLLHRSLLSVSVSLALAATAAASEFTFKVVASGLKSPTGIVAAGNNRVYFTEIPTPGIAGGANAVKELRVRSGAIRTLHQGEPEPVNITIDHCDVLYWTCKSAGVILEQAAWPGAEAAPLLTGLAKPSGITVDREGTVYFTEVPAPGVGGGANKISSIETDAGAAPSVLHIGDPEPTDIAVARNGDLYWTCKSAGVILRRDEDGVITPILTGLDKPSGIALSRTSRFLYWTEVPTPGLSGPAGGKNKVWEYDLKKGVKKLVQSGDPEPTDITVAADGTLYWTCTSAGVIVAASRH
jgi:sugar lactone lactonase YvrE